MRILNEDKIFFKEKYGKISDYWTFSYSKTVSSENFLSVTLGSLRTLCTRSAKRTTSEFFHFLEELEGKMKDEGWIFQRKIGIFQREIWSSLRTVSSRVINQLSVKRLDGFVLCLQG